MLRFNSVAFQDRLSIDPAQRTGHYLQLPRAQLLVEPFAVDRNIPATFRNCRDSHKLHNSLRRGANLSGATLRVIVKRLLAVKRLDLLRTHDVEPRGLV